MSYSDFGLDNVKKSTDDGEVGLSHCPWCQKEVKSGFSLCFSNFCICDDCVAAADGNKKQWRKADEYGCFKCCKGKIKKEFDKLYYDLAGTLSICKNCLDWAKEVLNNKEKYIQNMLQDILKNCTVDGMVVKLPAGQLDRKVYEEVKKALWLIGGKWKAGRIQGFVFEQDPTELLAQLANGEQRNLKKEHQFFATPSEVADMMIDQLPVITPEMLILEPSAGDGAIIKRIRAYASGGEYKNVDCFETMDLNRTKLTSVPGAVLIGRDFLECDLKDTYDIVIANPPFTKNQDIDHIGKMWEVVKPGGVIISLTSPSWTFGSQKKQVLFREWLTEIGAEQKEIEEGAFKNSGTTIRTMLLKIVKPVDYKPVPWEIKISKPTEAEEELQPAIQNKDHDRLVNEAKEFVENNPIREPAEIIQEMKNLNKEIVDGTNQLEKMLSPKNLIDMDFFQQLAAIGNIDLTIRIMQKNDKLTLNIMPGNRSLKIQPIIVTGTPEELDQEFFATIVPGVEEVKGLVSNIAEVKEQAQKLEADDEDDTKEDAKKAAPKKKPVMTKPKKEEVKAEAPAPLFD